MYSIAASCPSRFIPTNGRITYSDRNGNRLSDSLARYPVGSNAVFICDEGYTVIGNSGSVCLSNGRGSNNIPSCEGNVTQ